MSCDALAGGFLQAFLRMPLVVAVLIFAAIGCQPNAAPSGGETVLLQANRAKAPPEADLHELAEFLRMDFAGKRQTEALRMLSAIQQGARIQPGEGWFGAGQSRYTWDWLARTQGLEGAREIARRQFRADPSWFERLDRNRDGRIAAGDLDWSDRRPYVQQYQFANQLLQRIDRHEDGRLTRDEWLAIFEKAADGRGHVTTVDLVELLLAAERNSAASGDAVTGATLIRSLARGDIGSPSEGPAVDAPAPDFELKTHDGKQTIRLSELRGSKPIVLVFGNFTCGPFRSAYPLIEVLVRRYQREVQFVGIYVRETHPSDGWRMESNARLGVELAQPKTYDDRVAAAQQCHAALEYSMPLAVDTIDDRVGNAYSGMPSRLYVIDCEGKVAYKSGRGPFGFKPGEMEHALLMTLVDEQVRTAADQ